MSGVLIRVPIPGTPPTNPLPALKTSWSNLFYACPRCNTLKSDFVSTGELFVPNPCQHTMSEHLQYHGVEIEAYTEHGRWMVELLRLREPERRRRRELSLSALALHLERRIDLLRELTAYEAMRERGEGDPGDLTAAIEEASADLAKVDGLIEFLTGEPMGAV